MKKLRRIVAMVLVLAMAVALVCSMTAFAATTKTVKNAGTVTVQTGKPPVYAFLLKPQITVKNNGSTSATIIIENSKGQVVSQLTCLKAGKSHTFSLSKNQTYTVIYSGHYTVGPYSNLTISAKRYINRIG